ncbi:MAG: M15 family metallopeptidase [Clostridium sp.]|nr:MAG: M15 family metallopeptidase [Clostridium sp.]
MFLSDGYRSYEAQEKMFESYKNSYGYEEADKNVARPGHSEYQTGISFQIVPYNKVFDKPRESEEYLWLRDNAYKYGFIFRYPEDKKDITLFDSYTWRLRYVGTDVASIIENEKICFEEYYAYFVDKE